MKVMPFENCSNNGKVTMNKVKVVCRFYTSLTIAAMKLVPSRVEPGICPRGGRKKKKKKIIGDLPYQTAKVKMDFIYLFI